MANWTMSAPQPPPPGPADDDREDQPDWARYIQSIVSAAWTRYYNFPVFHPEPEDWWANIEVELGDTIWAPLEGESPGPWEKDDAVKDGELEVAGAKRKFDFTRYKRTYPSITLQQFREVIVTVKYGWGSWWKYQIGQGRYKSETTHRAVFWEPMGDPQTFTNKTAYRWQVTSEGRGIRIVIGKLGEHEVAIGAQGGRYVPNPPKNDSPPKPDDFDDEHDNPWPDIDLTNPWPREFQEENLTEAEKLRTDLLRASRPLQNAIEAGSQERLTESVREVRMSKNLAALLGVGPSVREDAKLLGWASEPIDLGSGRWVHSSIIKRAAKKGEDSEKEN